ncbi:MAG: M20 family metallopeptidase [Candidatus Lokiarchaeota archaeon]|nr:M20 family metallopeptidase [Candidatus Lokiarchaeota archaeon]
MNIPKTPDEEIINTLKRLVKFPSENPPGLTEDIVNFIISDILTEKNGFRNEVITHVKKGVELHNLVSKIGVGDIKIVFSGHFDVVPSGTHSSWTLPPYSAEIKDGYLHGRGSADMKGGLVSLLYTLKNISKIPDLLKKYTFIFAGTADEESGMTGSLELKNRGIVNNASFMIIAEPTNMKIGIAEKGLLWIVLKIRGKPAHGSTPHEGINAIECALGIVPQIHGSIVPMENNILGKSTVNIGTIQGGSVINVVPELVKLELDFRLVPEEDPEKIIQKLKQINLGSCTLELEKLKDLPALQTDVTHPFIKNLSKLANTELIGLPFATDAANLIDPKHPIPFIIFGPGDPKFIHAHNERVKIKDVCDATNYLTQALISTYLKER